MLFDGCVDNDSGNSTDRGDRSRCWRSLSSREAVRCYLPVGGWAARALLARVAEAGWLGRRPDAMPLVWAIRVSMYGP